MWHPFQGSIKIKGWKDPADFFEKLVSFKLLFLLPSKKKRYEYEGPDYKYSEIIFFTMEYDTYI